jgi:hypothetical protein
VVVVDAASETDSDAGVESRTGANKKISEINLENEAFTILCV